MSNVVEFPHRHVRLQRIIDLPMTHNRDYDRAIEKVQKYIKWSQRENVDLETICKTILSQNNFLINSRFLTEAENEKILAYNRGIRLCHQILRGEVNDQSYETK